MRLVSGPKWLKCLLPLLRLRRHRLAHLQRGRSGGRRRPRCRRRRPSRGGRSARRCSDRGRAGARGAGDGDDRMLDRHRLRLLRRAGQAAAANSGERSAAARGSACSARCARPSPPSRRRGHALVQARRHDVEDAPLPSLARAARLLHDEGDRIRLVDEAQAAVAVGAARVARVEEDAAADEDAVGLGDERGDPAHVESAPRGPSRLRDNRR